MPYKSKAQERWAHTPAGIKALGGKAKVAEWDNASKGLKLPKRVKQIKQTVRSSRTYKPIKRNKKQKYA